MDKGTLVREQLDGGEKLITRLVTNQFAVSAAGWVATTDDGQPYLHIASPEADEKGLQYAYGALAKALDGLDADASHWMERIDSADVKMLRTTEPLARGLADVNRRYPGPCPTWFNGPDLGGVAIDGAYLYPLALFQPQPAVG